MPSKGWFPHENLRQASDYEDVCKKDISPSRSILTYGKQLQMTAATSVVSSSRELTPRGSSCGTTGENDKEQEQLSHPRYKQRTYAATVTEIVTQELTLQSQSTMPKYSELTFLVQSIVFRDRRRRQIFFHSNTIIC